MITEKGKADIQIGQNAIIHLENNSQMKINEFLENGDKSVTKIESREGRVFAKIIKPLSKESIFQIQSESYVAGVRGTEFIFSAEDKNKGPAPDKPNSPKSTEKKIPEGVFVNEGSVKVSRQFTNDDLSEKNEGFVVVDANEQVIFNDKLQKEILSDFIKDKMKIFKTLNAMKEENYNLLKNKLLQNKSLLNSIPKINDQP